MKDAIEFKSKIERWYENVQLGFDGVFPVEVKLKGWVKFWKSSMKPYFELGNASPLGFVSVVVLCSTRSRTEVVSCQENSTGGFEECCFAVFADGLNKRRPG
jgi:hypothetical protein